MQKNSLYLRLRHSVLSLEVMCLMKIAADLCNNQQLLELVLKCKYHKSFDNKLYARREPEWQAVYIKANELVSQICNHKYIFEMIMDFIWPTCYRMIRWKSMYAPSINNQLLQNFYFDEGKIDTLKTAKNILGNKNIPIKRRFVLACSVCLGEKIEELWSEMSNDDRSYFHGENMEKIRPLLLFWVSVMERSDISTIFMNRVYKCAFDNGLLEALKYLFSISSKATRQRISNLYMQKIHDRIIYFDGLEEVELQMSYFLFFEMKDFEQNLIWSEPNFKHTFLFHFTDREHFLKALEESLKSPSKGFVMRMLNLIFNNFHLELNKYDDYCEIFYKIWKTIPAPMKKEIAKIDMGGLFISALIRDNFPFLLRKDAFEKIAILTSSDSKLGYAESPFGFNWEKWGFLHYLIGEEITTVPYLNIFREELVITLKIRTSVKATWNRFMRFIRDIESRKRQQKK